MKKLVISAAVLTGVASLPAGAETNFGPVQQSGQWWQDHSGRDGRRAGNVDGPATGAYNQGMNPVARQAVAKMTRYATFIHH